MSALLRSAALTAALTFGLGLANPVPAHADSAGREFGMGLATVCVNILYMPTKLVYATGGSIVGGLAWVFSGGDSDVSRPIIDASVRGDYLVVADHLRRQKELEFVGRSPAHERARDGDEWNVASPPAEGYQEGF